MKKILVAQPIRREALRLFEERSDIRFEVMNDFSRDTLLNHIADADALIVRDAQVPVEVLDAARILKVISRHGVGFDNIPVDYCTGRRIPVTVVGDVNATTVAEHTLFLMLAVARKGVQLDGAVRSGDFAARGRLTGVELRGRTLLLIGFGRIGREVATRASAFGMRVLVFDPFADRNRTSDAAFVDSLREGLTAADVLSLHVPLNPHTRNLIGERELGLLRQGAIIINTARGGIVDEEALVLALKSGKLRGAGLDTFAHEPLPSHHPLTAAASVVLSPHSAALTEETLIAMGVVTARNALAGLDGTLDPSLVVNPSVLSEAPHAFQ
jgi:D-3-phosphoglycerate dehydrogenase